MYVLYIYINMYVCIYMSICHLLDSIWDINGYCIISDMYEICLWVFCVYHETLRQYIPDGTCFMKTPQWNLQVYYRQL